VLNLNNFSHLATLWGTANGDAIDKAAAENHAQFIKKVLEETKDNKNIQWKVVLQHQSPYGGSYHNNYYVSDNGTYIFAKIRKKGAAVSRPLS